MKQPLWPVMTRACPTCGGVGEALVRSESGAEARELAPLLGMKVEEGTVPGGERGWRCSSCGTAFGTPAELDGSPLERLVRFRQEVSALLQRDYVLTWDDACGDWEPLVLACRDGETAEAFVEWWAGKYDLDPLPRR